MALDDPKDGAASEQHTKERNDQPVGKSAPVPVPVDANKDEEKKGKIVKEKEVEAADEEVEAGKGKGNEGDPKNPSSTGILHHTLHTLKQYKMLPTNNSG